MLCCHIAFLPPPPDKWLLKMFMAVVPLSSPTQQLLTLFILIYGMMREVILLKIPPWCTIAQNKTKQKRNLALSQSKVAMKKYYLMEEKNPKTFAMCVWSLQSMFFPCGSKRQRGGGAVLVLQVHKRCIFYLFFSLKILFFCSNVLYMNNFQDIKNVCRIFMLCFMLCISFLK